MLVYIQVRACLAYALLLVCSWSWSATALPVGADSLSDASDEFSVPSRILGRSTGLQTFSQLVQEHNSSDSVRAPNSAITNPLERHTIIWEITDTLSITINIGEYRLSTENIQAVLSAAEVAIGKKSATALVEQKFTQKTGSLLNRMLFDIEPDSKNRKLTWGDVGEVVGKDGLLGFFNREGYRCNIDFELFDDVRGRLGEGELRKWYHLGGGNDTGLAGSDLVVS